MKDIVNVETLAREMGVSAETLRRWVRTGQWPKPQLKFGASRYWSRKVLARDLLTSAWAGKRANDAALAAAAMAAAAAGGHR